MLTARTFAKEKGISYTTVMAWLRDNLIPGAQQQETPMGMVWQIPQSSLALVERQKPGPKKQGDGEVSTATDAPDDGMPSVVMGEERPAKMTKKAGKKMGTKAGGR